MPKVHFVWDYIAYTQNRLQFFTYVVPVAKVVFLHDNTQQIGEYSCTPSTQPEGQIPVLDAKHTLLQLLEGWLPRCALKTESLCQLLTKLPNPAASGSRAVTWNHGYTQNKKKFEVLLSQITRSFLIPSFLINISLNVSPLQ